MAKKINKIIIPFSFEEEGNSLKNLRSNIQNIAKELNGAVGKTLSKNLADSFGQTVKDINKTFTKANKPIYSKKEAIDLGNALSAGLKKSYQAALQLKETLQKAFDPKMAKEAADSISSLEKRLANLNTAREKWSSLTTAFRGSGDASKINRTIKQDTARKKELVTARQNGSITKEEKEELKEINARLKENNALLEEKKRIEAELNKLKIETGKATAAALDEEISQTKELITETRNSTLLTEDYEKLTNNLNGVIDATGQLTQDHEDLGEKAGDTYIIMKEAAEQAEAHSKKLSQTLREITGFGIGINDLIRGLKQLTREAFEFYKSLDKALTDITIVSNLTRSQVQALTSDFISLSRQTGMAIDDIAQASVIFFQQGLSTKEVMEMTEVTAQFAKVAGSTVEKAADQLTAAINGYQVGVEGAIDVADKLNAVAAKSAASIDEIATAMSKAASQANQAGLSMDKFYAILATVEEVTREAPENIGTSLKTIMARMQQIKEGNNTEDDTDVNDVETALRSVGISLRDTNGQLKDLEQVLDELGPKWNGLDRNTQAYLGTIIAGTRQQSRFISMMQNWDRVLELTEVSENSAGQQALMHKKAMEGLDASINTLRNSWQEFLTTLTNSDVFIKVLQSASQLLQNISKNSSLETIITKAMSLFMLINKTKIIEGFKQLGSSFKNLGPVLQRGVSSIKLWASSTKDAEEALRKYEETEKAIAETRKQINDSLETTKRLETELTKIPKGDVEGRQRIQELLNDEIQTREQLTGELESQNKELKKHEAVKKAASMSTEEYINSMINMMATVQMSTMAISAFLDVLDVAPEAGQAVSGVMQTAAGAIGVFGSIAKAVDEKTKISAPLVYAILTGGIMVISGIVALGKALNSMTDTSGKIKELDNNMKELNKEYTATATEIKGLEDYLNTYDELKKKIILTTQEQEKLNEAIEGMAELGEVEYWTDEEGHYHIKREKVKKAIEDKKNEKEEKQTEMRDIARKKLYNEYRTDITASDANEQYFTQEAKDRGLYTATITYDGNGNTKTYYFQTEEEAKKFKDTLVKYSEKAEGITYDDVKKAGAASSNFNNTNFFKNRHNLGENNIDVGGIANTGRYFDKEAYAIDQVYTDYIDTLTDFYEGSDTLGKAFNKSLQQQIISKDKMKELYTDGDRWDVENYVNEQDEKMKDFYSTNFGEKVMDSGIEFYKKMIVDSRTNSLDLITQEVDSFYQNLINNLDKNDADYQTKLEAIKAQREATKSGIYEQYGFDSEMVKSNGLSGYSASSLGAMNKLGIFNGGEGANQVLNAISNGNYASSLNSAFAISDENGALELYEILQNITGEMENIPDDAKIMMTKLETELGSVQVPSWSDWSEQFKDITNDARKFAEIMKSLREEGGMSIEQFGDLMGMLDDLGSTFANTGDLANLQNLTNAIDQMDFAIDASTSTIKINGEAMESLGDIEQTLTEVKIEAARAELRRRQTELEAQRAGLVAYSKILAAELQSAGEEQDTKEELLGEYKNMLDRENKLMADDLDRKADYYIALQNMKKADIDNLGADKIKSIKDKATTESKLKVKLHTGSGKQITSNAGKQLNTVLQEISILDNQIANLKKMQELWKKMKKVDWSKWGSGSKSGASKAAKEYEAQLNKIAELLTHIEQEEAKINTLEKLRAMQIGRANVKNLLEEIKLTEHLQEDYVKKYNLEKQAALKARSAIQNAYGKIISFNEDGSYKLNEAKYNKLNNEQKEALDTLVEGYKQTVKDATASYDKIIENIKKEMEYRQEAIDKYIEGENKLVEAIKTREKKILDAKLKAIDKEIEAIEKVSEARRKARKEENDAAEMSGLQVDLQRALMDSSGASASQILSLQKQIKDKQKEMADNSFDDMVNDMKQQLEDEKEMEQALFDERLEEMDWYWAEVDRIMGNGVQSVLDTMKLYSDEYNQASEVQQAEVLKGWTDTFERAVVIGKIGAQDMQAAVAQIQDAMNNLNPKDIEAWLNFTKPLTGGNLGIQDNQTRVDVNRYASGGMNYRTGLAWLDGTRSNPEAVLNAAQTKAFLSFADDLAALRASGAITNNSNVIIDTISFNVESMSSPEDGEKAFDAFVDRFKQIGAKQGISINGTANRF